MPDKASFRFQPLKQFWSMLVIKIRAQEFRVGECKIHYRNEIIYLKQNVDNFHDKLPITMICVRQVGTSVWQNDYSWGAPAFAQINHLWAFIKGWGTMAVNVEENGKSLRSAKSPQLIVCSLFRPSFYVYWIKSILWGGLSSGTRANLSWTWITK